MNSRESISMSRILGLQPKNRTRINTAVEEEFLMAIRENTLDLADTINVSLEKHLMSKGML